MKRILAAFVFILLNAIVLKANQDSTFHFAVDSVVNYCKKYQKAEKIPGMSITIIKDDSIHITKNFGYSDISYKLPVNDRTRFRLASLSKPITSAAIMLLLEKRLLSLDDTVRTIIKDFPQKRWPILIRNLLFHSAGIRHYRKTEYDLQSKYKTIKEGLNYFKKDTLLFEPGTKLSYSSYGYNLLGAIIETVTKKSFREFIFENFLRPANCLSIVPDNQFNTIEFSTKFYYIDSNKVVKPANAYDSRYKLPTGGYLSNSYDYSKLINKVFNSYFFSDSVLAIYTNEQKLNDDTPAGWCLGWQMSKIDKDIVYWHLGSTIGASSAVAVIPKKKLVITWLNNMNVNWTDEPIMHIVKYFLKSTN